MSGAVSKSLIRAMSCESYYAGHYLADAGPRLIASPLAQTGTDFHAYRAAYINELRFEGATRNPEWAAEWLRAAVVTEDARKLIVDDIRTFSIDPDAVIGTEIFASIGPNGERLELETGPGEPGRISTHPDAAASGSIDMLEIRETTATIVDYKSGWSAGTVSEFEPPVYAALVLAHFTWVTAIEFRWEFVRLRAEQSFSYERAQLPDLLAMINGSRAKAADIERRYRNNGRLGVNPWAGLCGFCALRCPLREAASRGGLAIPPVQTEEDARAVAGVLYASRQIAAAAAKALQPWLGETGKLDLGGNFVLELAPRITKRKPLLPALEVLGFDTSSMQGGSPAFGVPMESLTLGGLTSFEKTKKRAGLSEKLRPFEKRSVSTLVQIRRVAGSPAGAIDAGEGGEDADAA